MNQIIEILGVKPGIGLSVSGGSFFSGFYLSMGLSIDIHIMVNQILQTVAFAISIIVGILTIISWIKKNRKKK